MTKILLLILQMPIFILGLLLIGFLIYELISGRKRAPFIPSSPKAIKTILKKIPLPASGLVLDLGAGEGSFLRAVKKQYPKSRTIGYEISALALLIGKIRNLISDHPVTLINQDMLTADVSKADIIFCFLLSTDLTHLEKKLRTEMKPEAKVISNTFSFAHWTPTLDFPPTETKLQGHIRVYVVPAR